MRSAWYIFKQVFIGIPLIIMALSFWIGFVMGLTNG